MILRQLEERDRIRVSFLPGVDVQNACLQATQLANQKNKFVAFQCSGIDLVAKPLSDPDAYRKLIVVWEAKNIYRNRSWSPKEKEERVTKSQAKAKALKKLLSELPNTNFGDIKKALTWLCRLSEMSPEELYKWNDVLVWYQNYGYRAGKTKYARVSGERVSAWKVRVSLQGQAMCLIGAALQNVQNSGVPNRKFLYRAKKFLVKLEQESKGQVESKPKMKSKLKKKQIPVLWSQPILIFQNEE